MMDQSALLDHAGRNLQDIRTIVDRLLKAKPAPAVKKALLEIVALTRFRRLHLKDIDATKALEMACKLAKKRSKELGKHQIVFRTYPDNLAIISKDRFLKKLPVGASHEDVVFDTETS